MNGFDQPDKLRQLRPLLLACEAIGWLHMAGKAKVEFLKDPNHNFDKITELLGDNKDKKKFNWLNWLENYLKQAYVNWKLSGPAPTFQDLIKSMFRDFMDEESKENLVGLLQAGHAMASGIEKNVTGKTSEYLGQNMANMWLSSAFGNPTNNLLGNPLPQLLTDTGWAQLLEKIKKLLLKLEQLGGVPMPQTESNLVEWWNWREDAVGHKGWLRQAFTSTLAETRLPNNDITLFDQSYVAAALFKSSVAGAILEGQKYQWNNLKQDTQWRMLIIGMSADYYESRAVKIGDWIGALKDIKEFYEKVRKLVEVELAIGSLLYADSEIMVFTFPGERRDRKIGDLQAKEWEKWFETKLDVMAREADIEIPPYCSISEKPSRSLIKMTAEIDKVRQSLSIPIHRTWDIREKENNQGHICPVCLARKNNDPANKQKTCTVCDKRRKRRMIELLEKPHECDTIWITEAADANDRLALITMSLDIEQWLNGGRLDALRAQAILEWSSNSGLKQNPIKSEEPYKKFVENTEKKMKGDNFPKTDNLFTKIHAGFEKCNSWEEFYTSIVEDRSEAPSWKEISGNKNLCAKWITHQLFCKLASPGRIYRFQRQSEEFFRGLITNFREIVAKDKNYWRTRRLVLIPDQEHVAGWQDKQIYNGRLYDAPVSLLYREDSKDFITICNLARIFELEKEKLKGNKIILTEEDMEGGKDQKELVINNVKEIESPLVSYYPMIPLEISPVRFRVIVPLEAASACVDEAVKKWGEEFGRVWDRLPLRIGTVAFRRCMPFQAVIEAARNIEQEFERETGPGTWHVDMKELSGDAIAISLTRTICNERQTILRTMMPIKLPGDREDVFYPYLAVENAEIRYQLDFQHPEGQIYRHAQDIKPGDNIKVYPARIATVFLDQAAKRFELPKSHLLMDWLKMRKIWDLLDKVSPSQTALRGVWSELLEKRDSWKDAGGEWLDGAKEAWLAFARALLFTRLRRVKGDRLETLVQAADSGILEWCLEWHINILKKSVSGGKDDNSN